MIRRKTYIDKVNYRSTEKDGRRIIEAVIPYNSPSVDLGGFREIILPSAFKKTLGDKCNVYALYNHDDGKVLGSTKSGTFELRSEKSGLLCKLLLGNSTWANDAWDVVNRGDCSTMSFGFISWDVENKGNIRYLKSVQLEEVSFCVSHPAYREATSVAYKRYKRSLAMVKRKIDVDVLNDILVKETLTEDDLLIVKSYIEELQKLIPAGGESQTGEHDPPAAPAPKKEKERENPTETEALKKIAELEEKVKQMEDSQKQTQEAAMESIQKEIEEELEKELLEEEEAA
ncbi:MAG: HK97 family phage prohead protease [Treponema sp.]|jgi:HK97 family phage prohead protease|nr:HK97 family phage prohead protease [Treponema sp.]